jgi:hypothetical protein
MLVDYPSSPSSSASSSPCESSKAGTPYKAHWDDRPAPAPSALARFRCVAPPWSGESSGGSEEAPRYESEESEGDLSSVVMPLGDGESEPESERGSAPLGESSDAGIFWPAVPVEQASEVATPQPGEYRLV